MSTTHTVPKHILDHPGFISVVRADSTGYYEQNKESVYTTLLAMCGTQEMLQTFLDGISNDDAHTVGNPPTQFERRMDVGLNVQIGFNYREIGVVVDGYPQLLVEMSLLTGTNGSYFVVRPQHGLRGLEEKVDPSGSVYYVSVGNVFRIKCERNGRVRYTDPFIVPYRA